MILEKIKTALASEINPKINNYGKNKPASVLIIIYDNPPKILMTKKLMSLILMISISITEFDNWYFDDFNFDDFIFEGVKFWWN